MALSKEQVLSSIQAAFGASILNTEDTYEMLTLTIDREQNVELATFLRDKLGFIFLTDLTGVHYPDDPTGEKLGVVYHFHNLVENFRLRVKTFFPKESPFVDSLTSVYAGANWMERETFDFYGIVFKNHPDLKRILNVDDLDYFPLRKEYALEDPTRDDKDDRFFGR